MNITNGNKMKATELRIGNWVNNIHTGNPYQINIEKMIRLLQHFKKDVIYFEPIPLTEEWLVNFGFEKSVCFDYGERINYQYEFFFNIGDDIERVFHYDDDEQKEVEVAFATRELWPKEDDAQSRTWITKDIKHVHQLQNLYFALTNRELEI
jgi:hypothetical protein